MQPGYYFKNTSLNNELKDNILYIRGCIFEVYFL